MPTYSHWRMQAIASLGQFFQVAEVAYLDAAGVDLSVGGTASASTVFSGFPASQAFDKNTATEWATISPADTEPWLQYQHAAPVAVDRVSVRFSASLAYLPAAFWFIANNTGVAPWNVFYPAGAGPVNGVTRLYELVPTRVGVDLSPTTYQAFAPEPVPPWSFVESRMQFSGDRVHGGPGRIYGNVYQKGEPANIPLVRRVRLLRDVDSLCLRETWSNAVGWYEFRDLSMDYKYSVIATDHPRNFRGWLGDNLTPELMA